MRFKFLSLVCCIMSFSLSINTSFGNDPSSKILTIASGVNGGNYFKVANSLCRFVNTNNTDANIIKCVSRTTNGTLENINITMQDKSTIGIGQLDAIINNENANKLQFVAKLYIEPVFILASKTSDAKTFDDVILQDKINIGSPKSGENATAKMLINAKNWKKVAVSEYGRYEIMSLLCSNRMNIAFLVSSNPSDLIFDIIKKCNAKLVPFTDEFINSFTTANKGFERYVINKNTYPEQDFSVNTIATSTILFAHGETSEKIVEALLKSMFVDLKALQNSNPAFANRAIDAFFKNDTELKTHNGTTNFLKTLNK